jgi:hypothetical protein
MRRSPRIKKSCSMVDGNKDDKELLVLDEQGETCGIPAITAHLFATIRSVEPALPRSWVLLPALVCCDEPDAGRKPTCEEQFEQADRFDGGAMSSLGWALRAASGAQQL